jgi:arginyl-tRNA synthetase
MVDMMNLFDTIHQLVMTCLSHLQREGHLPFDADFSAVTIQAPKDPTHGDMATNAAMLLAKLAGCAPRFLAEQIAVLLTKYDENQRIDKVEIAGAGFINIRLKPYNWIEVIKAILLYGDAYGQSNIGHNKRVNVEYVSANPTGPMHVGHARGAVFGDVLARILAYVGYNVTKEYYVNDAGAQINVLARSAYQRYRQALGKEWLIVDGDYPGDYLIDLGQLLAKIHTDSLLALSEQEAIERIKEQCVASMLDLIRQDLAQMGIMHDVFISEKMLHQEGQVNQTIEILKTHQTVYYGMLPRPKGKPTEEWEEREQWLFRTTDFGDDVDRPLQKSDGSWTYFAADLAYLDHKIRRGFDEFIMVLGADHGGYVKRMQAGIRVLAERANRPDITLSILLCQLVQFMRRGEPLKMSKRAGTYVTVRDVVDQVGKDALRVLMLLRKNDMAMDFDLELAIEQSKNNPLFYIQYAHARGHSVLRQAHEHYPIIWGKAQQDVPSSLLEEMLIDPDEQVLMRYLAAWPRLVEQAAIHREPHRIAFYLQELASMFHGLWNKGNDNEVYRFLIHDQPDRMSARLVLIRAVLTVLHNGLALIGVDALESM